MQLIKNINKEQAEEIMTEWLNKKRDNYVQITSSAFEHCYRFNLWTTLKTGEKRMKKSFRIVPF